MAELNDQMLDRDYAEKYLIGSWLYGENREHIKLFTENDFGWYNALFKEMKRGKTQKDNLELADLTGISVTEIMTLAQMYVETIDRFNYFKAYAKRIIIDNMQGAVLDGISITATLDIHLDKIRIIDEAEVVTIEDSTGWFMKYLDEIDNRKAQKPLKYDKVIPGLNKKLGGLKRGELTTLSARPGVGKSTLALQTAEAIANEGHKVLYFNLEMTMHQIGDRLTLKHTDILHDHLRNGELTTEEWDKVTVLMDRLGKVTKNIVFKNSNSNIDYYNRIIEEEQPELVIVDQLSHLTANLTTPNIREKYIYMVERLKRIAIKYDVPVLLLAQLNRETTNRTEPTLEGLKESGAIEETSDNVLLLYVNKEEKDIKEEEVALPCIIKIAKNRQGEQGKVHVTFRKDKCNFTEEVWTQPKQHKVY